MREASATLKKISLELGGKSPNIFFADADFEVAVEGALFGIFFNQGEVCSAGSRILVQRPIYKRFVEAMVEKAKSITLGAPLDRGTKMGPLVSKEQFGRVLEYQEIGKREARLALGGGAATVAGAPKGYFVQPTIFYDVNNSDRIAREEIFGPVAAVIPFDDEQDALRIANDTYFGLAAAVWTRDIFRAMPKTGGGLIPAAELLMVGYGARQHVRKNALHHLNQEITITRKNGSFTLEECLSDLVKRDLVDRKDAVARAVHVEELARLLGSLG